MSKKGFTLVELLAVILIIGALAILIVPNVARYINKGYDEYYSALEKQLKIAANDYIIEHPNDEVKKLSTTTLLQQNYLTNEITDKSSKSCNASYVLVEDNNYNVCLICDGKLLSNNKKCK